MNKSITFVSLLFIVFGVNILQAQTVNRCATNNIYQNNIRNNPGYQKAVENAFDYARSYAQRAAANKTGTWDTIYHIPVVVHVVYNTTAQNIDDSLVYNQIEVLNQDYRRMNADTGNTRDVFKPVVGDAGIEFFLATTDPNGNPTTGITRTYTDTSYFSVIGNIFSGSTENGADHVKKTATGGIDAWDTDHYLNIWVCNMSDPNSFFGLVLGFSYPPDNAPNWPVEAFPADPSLHGVVIHYEVFGRNNPLAVGQLDIADRGRTAVHEVGHFLGLRHIWGDGTFSILFPDCSVDDGIADTPNSGNNSQATGCDTTKNTCPEGNPDLPDMFENYMDYSREECQNIFTMGQVSVMRAMLATSRSELPVFDNDSIPSALFALNSSPLNFSVAPNPTSGSADIILIGTPVAGQIIVNDLLGKSLMSIDMNVDIKIPINLESLPKGIYTILVKTADKFGAKKIILN